MRLIKNINLFTLLLITFVSLTISSCETKEDTEPIKRSYLLSFRPQLGEFHDGSVTFNIEGVGSKSVGNYESIYWSIEEGNHLVVAEGVGFMGVSRNIVVGPGSPSDYVLVGGYTLGDWPRIVVRGEYD